MIWLADANPQKDMPELDEFVIATIRKIMPYGAFCTLDEYGDREAFLHVSEVASRWVKNIHEFIRDGQKVVARVHRLTPEKNQIDISLRRVSEADKKLKMEGFKREKRAVKLFELCAKKLKIEPATAWKGVGAELIKTHGDIYSALEDISFNGETALVKLTIPNEWKKVLREVSELNIHQPEVNIIGALMISSTAPNAIESIKKALVAARSVGKGETQVTVHYLGAPRYRLTVKAPDYKSAEKVIETATAEAAKAMKGIGTVEFVREAE